MTGSSLSHSLQGSALRVLARHCPSTASQEWDDAVAALVRASSQPLSPRAAWRSLSSSDPPALAGAARVAYLVSQLADLPAHNASARQFWCDASAAACAAQALEGEVAKSPQAAGAAMAWARSLHLDRAAVLRVAHTGSLVCDQVPTRSSLSVPSAVVSLDAALAQGRAEDPAEDADDGTAATTNGLPVVQLRSVLLEADALASAVPFPAATAVVLGRLAQAEHLKFARQMFHATAPRLVAAAWGSRPRVHPWSKGGLRAVQDLGQQLQAEGRLRRPLAHAPAVAAAFVRGLVHHGRLAEAEQVHFAQRGQAANATLAALLPAVAASGQVQHMGYLLGDGARVGTRAPADAPQWLLHASSVANDDSAPAAEAATCPEEHSGGGGSPSIETEAQVLQRHMQAEADALAQGATVLRALGAHPSTSAQGSVAAAAHNSHRRRGVEWAQGGEGGASSPQLQRLLQLRSAYCRLLAAGCRPSLQLEQHLASLALQLCAAASSAAQQGARPTTQPEAAWRLARESLLSIQDTFATPSQDRASSQLYSSALHAMRSPWWFVGDPSLGSAHGAMLVDALCAAPEQLALLGESLALSRRVAAARSEDASRVARRVAAGLKQAQVPLMAVEERLKVVRARTAESGSPALLQAAAPWLKVRSAAHTARRAVADLRAAAAEDHAVRAAARPLRGSLSHIERLLDAVVP